MLEFPALFDYSRRRLRIEPHGDKQSFRELKSRLDRLGNHFVGTAVEQALRVIGIAPARQDEKLGSFAARNRDDVLGRATVIGGYDQCCGARHP